MDLLDRISASIDSILKTSASWSEKEYKMYKMLEDKVAKYQSKSKIYTLSIDDKKDICSNIEEQPWFEKSKHPSVIRAIFKELEVLCYNTESGEDSFLKLHIGFGSFFFNVRYRRTKTTLKYFVYFENSKHRGYVCYLDSTANLDKQKTIKLPDYNTIKSIVNTQKRRLENTDIVHIAAELLIYYDTSQEISKVNMGLNYPVSLIYLSKVITC